MTLILRHCFRRINFFSLRLFSCSWFFLARCSCFFFLCIRRKNQNIRHNRLYQGYSILPDLANNELIALSEKDSDSSKTVEYESFSMIKLMF